MLAGERITWGTFRGDAEVAGCTHADAPISAHRHPRPQHGQEGSDRAHDNLARGVPATLRELVTLHRILQQRTGGVLRARAGAAPATARQRPSTAGWNTSR